MSHEYSLDWQDPCCRRSAHETVHEGIIVGLRLFRVFSYCPSLWETVASAGTCRAGRFPAVSLTS